MKSNHIYMSNLHDENKLWREELHFFKDEIGVFENRLSEIASKNTKTEVLATVESIQNRFIRQKEVIDEINHEINVEEDALATYAQDHPIAVDHQYFEDHSGLRTKVERFKALYLELKGEFNSFTSKNM